MSKPCAAQTTAPRVIYPIGDFHVGKRLLFEGLTAAASHTFETSYRLSRTLNEQHGIDAVPSLCRNGQALYLAGDLPAALSNINAGLSLAYNSRFWVAYIDRMPIVLRPIELSDGKIAWYAEQRSSRVAVYPDAWPVAIGTQAMLVETQDPARGVALTYDVIWIDAIETFLSQAIALRLRNELLGPLAQNYDLTRQLESMYADVRPTLPELLQRCQNVCHALALRGLGDDRRAKSLLEQNLTLDSGFDHPLTPIALLELATIAASMGNAQEAEIRAGQASMLAARLNQIDILSEAALLMTRAADVLSLGQGAAITEKMLRWIDTRFGLMYLSALASGCESASRSRNAASFTSFESKFDRLTRNNEFQLPLLKAAVQASRIKHLAASNNSNAVQDAWQKLIQQATGADSPSPLLPNLIQASAIQIAMREGTVSKRILFDRLANLVQRPPNAAWLAAPWQSLVWDNLPLNDLYLSLANQAYQNQSPEYFIQLITDWHERQLRVSNALLDRTLSFRKQLQASGDDWDLQSKKELTAFHTRYANLKTNFANIKTRWNTFQANMDVNAITWKPEQIREWQQLSSLSASQYLEYAIESKSLMGIPTPSAKSLDFEKLRTSLNEGQSILGFFRYEEACWGYFLDREQAQIWQISDPKKLMGLQGQLLSSISAYSDIPATLEALNQPGSWTDLATTLASLLIPAEIQATLDRKSELKIIPHSDFWLLPFGLLLNPGANMSECWQAKYQLSYALSLASAGFSELKLADAQPTALFTRQNFFSQENAVDEQLAADVIAALPGAQRTVVRLSKDPLQTFPFAIVNAGSVALASDLVLTSSGNGDFIRHKDQTLRLDSVDFVDIASPKMILALDISNASATQIYRDPTHLQAWLRLHRHLDTQQILWKQWPVNGESTALFSAEVLGRSDQNLASSMQSAILSLWEFELNSHQEPRFSQSNRRGEARLLSGKLPIFWGGWKLVTHVPLSTKNANAELDR